MGQILPWIMPSRPWNPRTERLVTAWDESWGKPSQQRNAELAISFPALVVVGGKAGDERTAGAQAAFAFRCSLRWVQGRKGACHSLASGFCAAAAFCHSRAMSFKHSKNSRSVPRKQDCGLGQGIICKERKETLHVKSTRGGGQWAAFYPVQKLLSSSQHPWSLSVRVWFFWVKAKTSPSSSRGGFKRKESKPSYCTAKKQGAGVGSSPLDPYLTVPTWVPSCRPTFR